MPGPLVIALSGDVDVATLPAHSARLDDAIAGRTEHVILDLTGVETLDSTGLSLLTGTMRRLKRSRRRLAVVPALEGAVRRALDTTGLIHVLEIHSSVEDAVAALTGAPPVGR